MDDNSPATVTNESKKDKKKSKSKKTTNEGDKPSETSEPVVGSTSKEDKGDAPTKKAKKPAKKDDKKPASKEEEKRRLQAKRVARIKQELDKKKEEEDRRIAEEQEKQRKLDELRRIEEEKLKKQEERKARLKELAKLKKEKQKKEGTYMTAKQKQKHKANLARLGLLDMTVPERQEFVKKREQHESSEVKTKEDVSDVKSITSSKADDDSKAADGAVVASDQDETNEVANAIDDLQLKVSSDEDDWEKQFYDEMSSSEDGEGEQVVDNECANSEKAAGLLSHAISKKDEARNEEDLIRLAQTRLADHHAQCESKRSEKNLRCPIVCVLGHVDTGKTKILDKLRRTNVQAGEEGGITQQIGATNVPAKNILEATRMVQDKLHLLLPGLLIIDTPGHESFSNMRSRGSSLCDIAILVVDLMHGIEPQTRESIRLLKEGKTPFVVALNKIDMLYQWKASPHLDIRETLDCQNNDTKIYFKDRLNQTISDFAQEYVNVKLFWENENTSEYVSMIPTSAHTGDGMGNLMAYVCSYAQKHMKKRLSFSEELHACVMEVKEMKGLGMTIDAILINGTLRVNDTVIFSGQNGPIQTTIRSLYMPAPMKELRVKGSYDQLKEVRGAVGVKIIARDLDNALAGLPFYVARDEAEIADYSILVERELKSVLEGIKVSSSGVYVQASTLGSLEALMAFLKAEGISVMGINIGPIHKKDVTKASVMIEKDPTYAVILGFNVTIDADAAELAKSKGVKVFLKEIIYNLQDDFLNHLDSIKSEKKDRNKDLAIFPVKLRILPEYIFNKRNPIIVGVKVEAGRIKLHCPVCVITEKRGLVPLGKVMSIESNHKPMDEAKKDQEVCIRIDPTSTAPPREIGTHFEVSDLIISKISRASIDVLKEYFREDVSKDEWRLIKELKSTLDIV